MKMGAKTNSNTVSNFSLFAEKDISNLLNFLKESNIVGDTLTERQFSKKINMQKEKKYVEKYHENSIWKGENDHRWYTKIPVWDEDGNVIRKKKMAKSSEEALYKALYKLYHFHFDNEENQETSKDQLTMKDIYEDWLKSKAATRQSTTVHRLDCDWKKYYLNDDISKELIERPITSITTNTIEIWANTLYEHRGLNKKKYYNLAAVIKGLLKYAVKEQIIASTPYVDVEITKASSMISKAQSSQIYYLENAEALIKASFEEYFETNDIRFLIFPFLFYTGLRIGEALAINRFESINIEKRLLHISQMYARKDVLVGGKWKTSEFNVVDRLKKDAPARDVILIPNALSLIELIDEHYKKLNMNPEYLFTLEDGTIPKANTVRSKLERFCIKKFDKPDTAPEDRFYRSFHKMRKTYGSLLYKRGVHIKTIAEFMGHRKETTTEEYYNFDLSRPEESKKEIVDALDALSVGNIIKFSKKDGKSA
ncbi:MAG: site-specific integrase [Hespellia sp.]|nr:site-specific integrase [Hespellia sp.]